MINHVSTTVLPSLSDYLASHMGLYFPQRRWVDLERGIKAAAKEFGFQDWEECANWLMSSTMTREQIEVLASHLTIGETYFFRERASLDALQERILPELLIRSHKEERPVRIWSAGCCTGEEPYSIAILLDWLMPERDRQNVSILATDINPEFLRKASKGIYGEWSFRGTPSWIRDRYFTKMKDGRFAIHPHVRQKVSFRYLNLASDIYPSLASNTNAMDVILCRNVLMYFSQDRATQVVRHFHTSLVDKGWLIVSPVETSNTLFSAFSSVSFPGALAYRKGKNAHSTACLAPQQPFLNPEEIPSLPSSSDGNDIELKSAAFETHNLTDIPTGKPLQDKVLPEVLNPEHGVAEMAHRAQDYANQGKLEDATSWCKQAIMADKLNPAHHYLLAVIQQEMGQGDEAAQSLSRALYLDPGFVLAHFSLGNLRLSQNKHQEAERHFSNALDLARKIPGNEVLPEADGMTAGRLVEIITAVLSSMPQSTTVQ